MSRVASAMPPSGDVAFSSRAAAPGLSVNAESFGPRPKEYGQLAFVPGPLVLPAAAAAGTVGTAAGSAAALPILAAIGGGVLLVLAGAWAITPEPQRAQLSQQALATAKRMLSAVPGLSKAEVLSHLKAIEHAFAQGIGAVKALATSWLQGSAPTSPQAPTRTAIVPTGGRLGKPPERNQSSGSNRPQGPQRPGEPTAIAPLPQPSAPQLSAADRRTLQSLSTQAAALEAQTSAGRVLSPAQLASGGPIRQLQQLDRGVEAFLRRPGAADLRAGLTSLKAEARQHVAGLYRLTVNKAVAGLLTAQTPAGQQTRAQAGIITPYTPQALKQLQEQARPLLNAAADAPLLAKLKQWLANEAATAPGRVAPDPLQRAAPGSAPPSAPAGLPMPGQTAATPQRQPRMPVPGSKVPDTRSVGTPEDIARRWQAKVAQALQQARQAYYDSRNTRLAGGDEAALVGDFYHATDLRELGVSLAQFQAHLQAGQALEGANGARVRASGGGTGTSSAANRFYMPDAYEPDPAWAEIMQGAVENAVRELELDPSRSIQEVIEGLIDFAKPRLLERAGEDFHALSHASNFGRAREGPPTIDFREEGSRVHRYQPVAIKHLQAIDGFGSKDYALLRYSYQAPWGQIKLGWLLGDWSLRDPTSPQNISWNHLEWTAAPANVIPEVVRAADQVFGKVRAMKEAIDSGSLTRDVSSLRQAVDLAAEVYWLLSQAWPFQRGSAGIADLSTKVIFDRLGIEVPLFKTDRYPNIEALLSPIETFKAEYPSHFQDDFRWVN